MSNRKNIFAFLIFNEIIFLVIFMSKKELLCPVGNMESLKQAIYNGADAVYLGGKKFGARKFALNFTNEELIEAINFVHSYGKKIYVTVNTIIYNEEINECLEYLEFLHKNGVDAVIMQDIGLMRLAHKIYPNLEIHASTQCHNHNIENINFMKELGVKRVILARELSLKEIDSFNTDMDLEIFIHGALCICYSGCCLFSSLNGTRSGNRGECVGSCRLPYQLSDGKNTIKTSGDYLISTKDLCSAENLKLILDSNVKSLKIEGRMKSPEYVGFVTKFYRTLIDEYDNTRNITVNYDDVQKLKKLFNREFTKGYLFDEENKNITNINTSNHIGTKLGEIIEIKNDKLKIKLEDDLNQEDGIRICSNNSGMIVNMLYNDKGLLINKAPKGTICYIDNKTNVLKTGPILKTIDKLLIDELANLKPANVLIDIKVEAFLNKPLTVEVTDSKNIIRKEYNIVDKALKTPITANNIKEQLSKTGSTIFKVNNITIQNDENIFISLKYLNEVRRDILEELLQKRCQKKNDIIIKNNDIGFNNYKTNKKTINVLVRTEEQLLTCLNYDVNIYTSDYKLYSKYKCDRVYYRLNRVMTNFNNYENENLVICETGSIKYAKNNNVISDYYLNAVNDYTINLLHEYGVKKVTLSVEATLEQIKALTLDKFNLELIVYGRAELMVMKHCPLNKLINNGDKPCSVCKNQYYLKDGNKLYPIITQNCYTHILHYRNINLIDILDNYKEIDNYRIELFDETKEQIENLINRIKKEID